MPPKADSIEDAMLEASAAMDTDRALKEVAAAKKFGAIHSRLIARRQGRSTSSSRGGHNWKLQEPQDQAIQDYILILYHASTSANLEVLILAAN